ncbi:MAG: metallophosphoesterase [Thermodesulfobacteriota bacterium]
MRIAVMSDTHDQIPNLRRAIAEIRTADCGLIIHCGDFVAPFMLKELEASGLPVHGVFGNNDGDQYLLTRHSLTLYRNITLHGHFGQVDAGGRRIAFMHDGVVADDIAAAGRFDVVCYGHYHVYAQRKIGKTLVVNPGEMLGKDDVPGFCIVDTETLEPRRVTLA